MFEPELDGLNKRRREACLTWQEACDRYLPVAPPASVWRYSRERAKDDPSEGWKLHVSATVLNADRILMQIGPVLNEVGVQFKAPSSLLELARLNSGLEYGYSQIGKFVTVYPRDDEEARQLAERLHGLTVGMSAPAVPFDIRLKPGSNVYYRFGAFERLEMETADGKRALAIRDPAGNLVPDLRGAGRAKPDWVSDLFHSPDVNYDEPSEMNPLRGFRVLRAMMQRGKGGVYQAVDLCARPPRICLLKEGRKDGETGFDGRDGWWRVRHEEHVMSFLKRSGVEALPNIYSSFEIDGNYYLSREFIDGDSLHELLARRKTRLPLARVLNYGIQLSRILARIHAAGWVWRDCKPGNILVTEKDRLRLLDFEGACPTDRPDSVLWSTRGFIGPELRDGSGQSSVHGDLYAVGSVLYLLLTGRLPSTDAPIPIEKLRPKVPYDLKHVVIRLLSANPKRRPSAKNVARILTRVRNRFFVKV
jgi:hypothetical protein